MNKVTQFDGDSARFGGRLSRVFGRAGSVRRTSLRGKFCLFVLLATLLTALVVTFVSIHSTREFLYSRLEQKLPSLLQRTAEKMDLLFQQRLHEVAVFAGADTLIEEMSSYDAGQGGTAGSAIEQFLRYLFGNSPQFESLFVLDSNGELAAWAGKRINLGLSDRRSLSAVSHSSFNSISTSSRGNIQIASAPISEYGGNALGTLHAVIDLRSLQQPLQNDELSDAGAMFLLDSEGRYIAFHTEDRISSNIRGVYGRPVPREPSAPVLSEYTNSEGQEVLGNAMYLPRIDGALVVEEPQQAVFAPVSDILHRTLAINLTIVLVFSLIAYRVAL